MNEHRRNEQNKSGLLVAEERRVGQQGTWIACELIETMLRGEGGGGFIIGAAAIYAWIN